MSTWNPTDEELRVIALEIPLHVLHAVEDLERSNPPGQTPKLLRKVAQAVWEASPGPAALERVVALEELLLREKGWDALCKIDAALGGEEEA